MLTRGERPSRAGAGGRKVEWKALAEDKVLSTPALTLNA